MSYVGTFRASLLSLIERLHSAATLLRSAREGERDTIVIHATPAHAKHVAGRLDWYAGWLTKMLPILVRFAGRKVEEAE